MASTASLDPFGHLMVGSGNPFNMTLNVNLSAPLGNLAGMDFDPTTGTLYIADGGTGGGNLYTLDPANGNVTLVGSLGLTNGLAGLAFTPEPGAFSLLMVGIAALCAAR
jgi:DNA-binding beta-propeller fold protein YncE